MTAAKWYERDASHSSLDDERQMRAAIRTREPFRAISEWLRNLAERVEAMGRG